MDYLCYFILATKNIILKKNPHTTRFIDLNSDKIPEIAIDTYFLEPILNKETGAYEYYLSNKTRERKPTLEEIKRIKKFNRIEIDV